MDARRPLGLGTDLHYDAALAQDCTLSLLLLLLLLLLLRLCLRLLRRRWGLSQGVPKEGNVVERLLVPRGQLAQLLLLSLRAPAGKSALV